jgi:hypothetical protein
LLEIFRRAEIGPAARWGVALLVLAVQVLGYLQSYYPRQNTVADAPEIARAIRVVTAPDDVLLGFGMNWSSILPYFSERRAVMVPDRFARDDAAIQQAIARVGAEHITAVVMFRLTQPGPEAFAPWLKKLGMDENPFMQTGEFNVYLRKDREPDALKKLASFPFKDVLLYGGQLNAAGQKPGVLYWVEQVPDRKIFSMMKPEPVRVTVPFGLGAEMLEGRYVFTAHSTSEVEIPAPAGARFITAQFGLNPAVYDRSDGIVVEIVNQSVNAGPQELFHRYLRPNVIKGDQGVQEVTLETTQPLTGTVRFRILPGGGPNFDWAYWAKIEIR